MTKTRPLHGKEWHRAESLNQKIRKEIEGRRREKVKRANETNEGTECG
jgi:hypothetical protein